MIRFSCPGCGAVFSVSDDKAGKTGNCPKCQTKFQIPAAEAPAPAPSPPPPPSNPFADLGDDAPKKKKAPSKADLDDDLPRKKKPSSKADLDDEDDRPKKKPARRDEDEDDAPPPKKKPTRAAVDDEDDRPKKKPARRDEEDDEDDRPKKKPARAAVDDDEDDYDDRPRKKAKGRRDDDYDDDDRRPVPRTKPGLATAAAILWLIWGVLWAGLLIYNISQSASVLGYMPTVALMMTVAQMLFMAGGSVIAILGGVRILNSSASSTKPMGWANMIYCIVVVVGYTLLVTFVFSAVGNAAAGGQVGASFGFIAFVVSCGFLLVVVSGHLLGSIFALTVNAKYEKWWRAYGKKLSGRSSRRRDDDDDYDD